MALPIDPVTCSRCDLPGHIFHGLGRHRLCRSCWLSWRDEVHIHQGGTLRGYCGAPVTEMAHLVGWEQAHEATCPRCISAFAPIATDLAAHGSAVPL